MSETLFAVAWQGAGMSVTWLEAMAVLVALAMVVCNIREIHWGWPLAMISSAMYLALFWHSQLYGNALLQLVFIAAAVWGWRQWLRAPVPGNHHTEGHGSGKRPMLSIASLSRRQTVWLAIAWLVLWVALGLAMQSSDAAAPWPDAFVTAGSLVGQYLLGRKYLQNWTVWLVVNLCSVLLFASQGLWPTAALYAVFALLSVLGWRVWRAQLRPTAVAQ
ncbi:MAG: nicotinamide riboside transporter PnuC [Betaproteobacteria bacterium]|jgi:nicotinamide mononucleotide transporter|nr:nicotinamide riboside transporter PnuC [Betaproteobacteria bacterium]NBS46425.1 nicotinamide riboside transporter PnuC [Betaproteobacteria bacterium]